MDNGTNADGEVGVTVPAVMDVDGVAGIVGGWIIVGSAAAGLFTCTCPAGKACCTSLGIVEDLQQSEHIPPTAAEGFFADAEAWLLPVAPSSPFSVLLADETFPSATVPVFPSVVVEF